MISAPLRPSSTSRVGATSRSPTPALAAVGRAASGAATRHAPRMDLVRIFITAIPTWLRNGAIAATIVRNVLFSVNHDAGMAKKLGFSGTPQSKIRGDVDRADVDAAGGRRIERPRPAD